MVIGGGEGRLHGQEFLVALVGQLVLFLGLLLLRLLAQELGALLPQQSQVEEGFRRLGVESAQRQENLLGDVPFARLSLGHSRVGEFSEEAGTHRLD